MIFLYMVLITLIIALTIGAKVSKLSVPTVYTSYSKPFLGAAVLLHRWKDKIAEKNHHHSIFHRHITQKRQLANRLQTLYPGETSETQLYRFVIERTSTMILIVFIGSLIASLVSTWAMEDRILEEGDLIYREAFGGVDKEVNLTAGLQGEYECETNLEIIVPAKKYSHEEAENLFAKMCEEIDEVILADNDSEDHITHSLHLKNHLDGYPFSISWESSNYEYLDMDGTVHNEGLTEPVLVELRADCLYEHEHWYLVRKFLICPKELSLGDQIYEELVTSVDEKNTETASEEALRLPQSISFGDVNWKERLTDDSDIILGLSILVCIMLVPMKELEVNSKLKMRSRQLLIEYPAFVSKLTLYIGAGMSIRNCFLRMGREAEASAKRRGKNDPLGVELAITARELELGISEYEAYENLGKRCGTREYIRFVTLLGQNLRKGSTDLILLLSKEAEDAFEIRKNEAKKLGEEASTKLLLPMVMMLVVVMIIIMVPAYMSFSS